MELENLPNEIICLIIKFLPEKSRRVFKQTSKRIYNCYVAHISMSWKKPPKTIYWCRTSTFEPCNRYKGLKLHDCVCEYVYEERIIGWGRY